jgi:hypothetical protein
MNYQTTKRCCIRCGRTLTKLDSTTPRVIPFQRHYCTACVAVRQAERAADPRYAVVYTEVR